MHPNVSLNLKKASILGEVVYRLNRLTMCRGSPHVRAGGMEE